ncbi:MAG: hypothetical protein ACO3N7_03795 [Kiritimatiellia bacterium]
MNTFQSTLSFFGGESLVFKLDGFAMVVMAYLLLSWLICVVAAFFKVKEVQYYVGLISMGLTLLVALVLGGLCRNFLPELAAFFTPSGLFLFGALAGLLVCAVPVIQYFWDISYWHSLACVVGGILILAGAIVVFQIMAHPGEITPARFAVPLFQNGTSGLIK